MKPIIRVENLSKQYHIGAKQASYRTLRDSLTYGIAAPFRRLRNLTASTDHRPPTTDHQLNTIWALNDINFEVMPGEVVGIIGRNGAGKSTLLKILSRITEPTIGRIDLYGRVISLLEVGTGFHAELTGRENIYLNGAILGMKHNEIKRRFDEIVAFAEVERFLETPVKHYSSGMYMRLAFAIAAHLDPEVLVIDEVLAVGDTEFQNKCIGKMQDVASKQGRTVLFVSHNLTAVKTLCSRGLVLGQGQMIYDGFVDEAFTHYSDLFTKTLKATFEPKSNQPSIIRLEIDQKALEKGDLIVDIQFKAPFLLKPPVPGIIISSFTGVPVFGSNTRFHDRNYKKCNLEEGVIRLIAKGLPLAAGSYKVSIWLSDWQTDYDSKIDILSFDFGGMESTFRRPPSEYIGYLDWPVTWEVQN